MRTLLEIAEEVQAIPMTESGGILPIGYLPKSKLMVPGEGKVTMPGKMDGLSNISFREEIPGLGPDESEGARSALLTTPSLIVPLIGPPREILTDYDLPVMDKRINPRRIGLAVCLRGISGTLLFGSSRVLLAENGSGFGSTVALRSDESWTQQADEFALNLLSMYSKASPNYPPTADPKSRPWKTVTALLGGGDTQPELPGGWQRDFRFAGGIYGIHMDIRPNPESSRRNVISDLRSTPPDGLLVWANYVTSPDAFIQPYRVARPGAYAALLGQTGQSVPYEDHLSELLMHLAEIRSSSDAKRLNSVSSWSEAEQRILALEDTHFVLSDRARDSLRNNRYPKPARMFEHVLKLELIAKVYHDQKGDLGMAFADFAMTEQGIEIALMDGSLSAPVIYIHGDLQALSAVPHVKVDDFKSPDNCGRIYFALDQSRWRLVVDHIGLHDYGM